MKAEVLYVADCPSYPAAVQLVREVLACEGLQAEILEVQIADNQMAKALSFRGSPTIRVNGRDVAGESFQIDGMRSKLPLVSGIRPGRLAPSRMDSSCDCECTRGGAAVKQGTRISASVAAIVRSIATVS